MVWRRGDQVAWRTLDDSGHAFIAALAAGVPLGEAAAGLVPAALPGLLAEAVLAGAFLAPTG